MFVIYLPDEVGFYGGVSGNRTLCVVDYDECMHFNSIYCIDWYRALLELAHNNVRFIVMKVEYENV